MSGAEGKNQYNLHSQHQSPRIRFLTALLATTLLFVLFFTTPCSAFSSLIAHRVHPSSLSRASTTRLSVIESLQPAELEFDEGQGGVRLAEESAIRIVGSVQHKPGSATAKLRELKRYKALSKVDASVLQKVGGIEILSVGRGKENYKNPGESIQKQVFLAPIEAAKDAIQGAASALKADSIVLNFLGGHDMQLKEVLSAAERVVVDMDIKTKAKVSFNTLSHASFEKGNVVLMVLTLSSSEENPSKGDLFGVDRAVALGELFVDQKGDYVTVVETDINTASA